MGSEFGFYLVRNYLDDVIMHRFMWSGHRFTDKVMEGFIYFPMAKRAYIRCCFNWCDFVVENAFDDIFEVLIICY